MSGKYDPILKELQEKMECASEAMEFEKAMEYRDLLASVKQIAQKQKITNSDGEDKDILAVATEDRDAVVQVFFIRGGRLIGRDHFYNDDCRQRAEGRDSYKFYQTVLCGDTICATRVDDPAGNRRAGGAGGMAV